MTRLFQRLWIVQPLYTRNRKPLTCALSDGPRSLSTPVPKLHAHAQGQSFPKYEARGCSNREINQWIWSSTASSTHGQDAIFPFLACLKESDESIQSRILRRRSRRLLREHGSRHLSHSVVLDQLRWRLDHQIYKDFCRFSRPRKFEIHVRVVPPV